MPFDTAPVAPESRSRQRSTRGGTLFDAHAPRPVALNLRGDIGVRVPRPPHIEARTDMEARWRFLDRAAGRSG